MTFKEVGDLINVRVFFLKIWEKTWVKTREKTWKKIL
jgi:hypothetical protein